uniref:Putative ovule protein n=1 Tax=Solanum chacoense TaxID=4108 RepID=A0A0V0HTH0_SOLCH
MEVAMSLNPLVRLPLSNSRNHEDFSLLKHSVVSTTRRTTQKRKLLVVEAKGRKGGMAARQYQRMAPPMPKIEDDGNPKFVIFIRMANVSSLYIFHFYLL